MDLLSIKVMISSPPSLKEIPQFQVKALIQVNYALDEKDVNSREIRALLNASDALKRHNLIVRTWNYSAIITYEKKKINFIPAWQWVPNPEIY